MESAEISQDGCTLTVRVPLTFRKRGGRKLVIAPRGQDAWAPLRPPIEGGINSPRDFDHLRSLR